MKRRGQARGQRFVKADYYELDWYYEECTDVLCADRVGQMTKTYSDIDAVTRLLEEKERDLELAARIGQSLLKKNKVLSERNEFLEEQVEHFREEVSQLRHDLSMKDELLQFYTSVAEESEGESTTSTPVRQSETSVSTPTFFPLDSLQKKLKDLEEENKSLRSEATHLETETISYEEKEQQLVNDCVKELRDANVQISSLAEDLARKSEDATRQQEEITHLLSQIVDLQKKAKLYAVENEELTQHLGAAKDAQRQLTAELRELQDKYAECMEMLHEAQEELKNVRNKTLPLSTPRRFHSLGLFPMDSLAAEIEGTMRKELQMDDPDVEEQRLQPKRVFQTVKNLNLLRQQRSSASPSTLNIPGSNQTSCFTSQRSSRAGTPRCNSFYGSEKGSGIFLDNRTSSILETPDDGSEDSNKRPPGTPGTPGTPGSRDLEAALRRLTFRRDNYLSEKRFFEEERERKLAYLAKDEEKEGGEDSGGPGTPSESLLSLCSHPSVWSGFSFTTRSYLPEKLQIVKPLEGSATLHAWQQLAQPHMGALLDHRPGVVTKGFRTLDHEHERDDSWQLDQPEEDEMSCDSFSGLFRESCYSADLPCSTSTPSNCYSRSNDAGASSHSSAQGQDEHAANTQLPHLNSTPSSAPPSSTEINGHVDYMPVHFPGKCMSHTSSTYTFTTCRILHPSDQLTSVSPSVATASVLSTPTIGASSIPSTAPPTPSFTPCCTPRRLSLSQSVGESSTNLRDSTKTTSTSLGLVRLLVEGGISASVYNPCSWDRVLDESGDTTARRRMQDQTFTDGPEQSDDSRWLAKRPDSLLLLPSIPPSSPPSKPASSSTTHPVFQFSPSSDDPPYYNTFLASKPARIILREVLGDAERDEPTEDESQTERMNLHLVDKLKYLRPLSSSNALFASAGIRNGALGGAVPGLNAGLRRNRSYPAMVGASMAMKDPGGPPTTEILIPHTVQTSHSRQTVQPQDVCRNQTDDTIPKTAHIPQQTLEIVTPHTIKQRHTRLRDERQDSTRRHNDELYGT
ncbi:trafficking kinesin-binding protein 1 isoform X3 [Gouania willdenowi]|uniref:Trafficking kinesin-binding protein 1-like n=1 Tax=Gouania willdenowi TaxID=441366 RepID=A0A8C5FZW7_GOUWI|nr:trafficking kinesin-binding protein 1-like isoform X3 [Gouania willdenowi]